ncbi:hypothetical protein IQ07DRAFT_631744 [Pyrenochaeta sp. DS3sAY3a]|nr:hypothetical protein IQ07DRAFT_631744 [Pyrenochaeta sp. DS3sAY3a]
MASDYWNAQSAPNVGRYVPNPNSGAPRQHQQSYGQQHSYAQQHTGYTQASNGYGSSSNSYTPSSAAYPPASTSYTTSSTSYAPASVAASYPPATASYPPTSASYTTASASYAPSATTSAPAQSNYASSSAGHYNQQRNGYSAGQDTGSTWNNSRSYSNIRETSSRTVESPQLQHNSLYEAPYTHNNTARDADSATYQAPHIDRTSYGHSNTPTAIDPGLTVKNALPPSSYTFRTAQPSPREPPPPPPPAPVLEQQPSTQMEDPAPSEQPDAPTGSEQGLEAEIRAMMAKMREFNSKDPSLLARIWEEERRSKTPKSTNAQNKSSPSVPAAQPVQQKARPSIATAPVPKKPGPKKGSASTKTAKTAQSSASVQPDTPNSEQKKATGTSKSGKNSTPKAPSSTPSATMAKDITAQATSSNARPEDIPQVRSTPSAAAAALNKAALAPSRGGTIWPSNKKTHLSKVAAKYLNGVNQCQTIESTEILKLLDGNPSYIELCEQLERFGLKFDRGAFAKTLLAAVPDITGSSRKASSGPSSATVNKAQEPQVAKPPEPLVANLHFPSPVAYPPEIVTQPLQFGDAVYPPPPTPVAQMVSTKMEPTGETMPEPMPEPKRSLTKEEAARKRNLSDLIDLTAMSEDDDFGPPRKKANTNHTPFGVPPQPTPFAVPSQPSSFITPPQAQLEHPIDSEPAIANLVKSSLAPLVNYDTASKPGNPAIRHPALVSELDRKKALRRNTYNPSTIARDVLLACGRHPSLRQLNQHLDILRNNLPLVGYDSDLSTIRWDWIDPGSPPPGYFKNRAQPIVEDIGEASSDDEGEETALARATSSVIGSEGGVQKAQALPQPSNPFQVKKRRGRPPRNSLPHSTPPAKPKSTPNPQAMSAATPPGGSRASGSGYRAFQQYGPNGEPLPKKKGRPVGWRKAIHGSPAAQARMQNNRFTVASKHNQASHPTNLRNVSTSGNEPILIDSRSPSVVSTQAPQYQSYPCKWEGCKAELHNLDTLIKHVYKMHRKLSPNNMHECLWGDCHKMQKLDPSTGLVVPVSSPYAFAEERDWRFHVHQNHLSPVSWTLGDGPAGGVFDSSGSETYLNDAQGRQVTPRITADSNRLHAVGPSLQAATSVGRGRGRPTKSEAEREVRDAQTLLVSQKKRIGGPGMDRGGATLVNDKRRKGFRESSSGAEDIYVDAEE